MQSGEIERELERHHAAAFGWALACCSWDAETAEDVLQTAYLAVLTGRARFAGRSGFRTWLFAVIRNTAVGERRRRAVRRLLPLGALDGRRDRQAADAETRLVASEEVARLRAALARLPRRQRELLHLVFYQELSIAEAARVLGIAVGTARTHYERGKSRMRELLSEDEQVWDTRRHEARSREPLSEEES